MHINKLMRGLLAVFLFEIALLPGVEEALPGSGIKDIHRRRLTDGVVLVGLLTQIVPCGLCRIAGYVVSHPAQSLVGYIGGGALLQLRRDIHR